MAFVTKFKQIKTGRMMNKTGKKYLGQFVFAGVTALIAVLLYAVLFQKNPVVIYEGKDSLSASGSLQNKARVHLTNYPGTPVVQDAFVDAAESSIHAVVHVKISGEEEQYYRNPLYEFFYGEPLRQRRPIQGFGSGVIISPRGYIVTNHHVIAKAENIEVTLHDKRHFQAELIGADPGTDLAVLKIEGEEFAHIPYGNSDLLRVGEWVLAVGNPFNLTSTVTAGIVSAKGRNLELLRSSNYSIESFIQTDAALNQGNSGGALVNLNGELVGINTAILSPSGTHAGNSFAIPVSIVHKVVDDIIEYGEVQRAILGVQIKNIERAIADGDIEMKNPRGVYVAGVRDGGSAEKAGIKTGDVVLEVNGMIVQSVGRIQEEVAKYSPNDRIEVKILRDGREKILPLTLTNVYGNTEIVKSGQPIEILGAEFREVPENLKRKLNLDHGVQISDPGKGKIASAGIKKDFIIREINNQKIYSLSDLEGIFSVTKGGVYIEGVYPNGVVAYYAFGL
jgi:serine protease Do